MFEMPTKYNCCTTIAYVGAVVVRVLLISEGTAALLLLKQIWSVFREDRVMHC